MWLAHASEWVAVVAVILGGVQWAVCTRRDLGVLTLSAVALAIVLGRGVPSLLTVGLAVGALLPAAVAWSRGSRAGVGRPGLTGLAVLIGSVAVSVPFVVRPLVPPQVLSQVVAVVVVCVAATAVVGLPLALERPGPRRTRRRWFRKVPITERR